jgi:hypothetical protein
MGIKRTLAVLATAGAVAAAAVTAPAPAQAHGIGPGLAFGLAAGALAAGALAASEPYYYGPAYGYGYYGPRSTYYGPGALRLLRRSLHLSAPLLAPSLVSKKARNVVPGFSHVFAHCWLA